MIFLINVILDRKMLNYVRLRVFSLLLDTIGFRHNAII